MTDITIHCDGGARGNPGPAGAGYAISFGRQHSVIIGKKYLGKTTNNVAEYTAVLLALRRLSQEIKTARTPPRAITVFLDSELIVRQLNGLYRVRNKQLHELYVQVLSLMEKLPPVRFIHIPRARNKIADGLVNAAIDAHFSHRGS